MKYKKFALLALAAGMIVGCGEGPSAPDWSAEFKTFVSRNFHNLSVPYFGSAELGSFTYAVHEEGYAEIFGGELESSAPIKTAAEFLEEKGYVDLYGAYRNDPAYAQYASMFEWSYPMEYRFEPENVGPRYIRIGLSGKLPEPNRAEGEEEPAEPARSFYAQVFDPYYYSWFDSYSTDLISIAFGQKTGERTYQEDETIAEELVPYLGQATYESNGNYISDLDDAIAEVAKNGYYRFWMQDVIREELDAYVTSLKEDEEAAWTVYSYKEHELEPGYLGRLYKLVSPSKYFTIDVYFADGEAMFRVAKAAASIPQIIKDMEPALFASNEVTAYDFEYFENEETGATGYQFLELSEEGIAPTGVSIASALAAYNGLVDDEDLDAVEIVEFGLLSAAEAQGVLDVKNHQVVVYADLKVSGIDWEAMAYTYYFFWGVEVSDWPTYPSELTEAFIAASGAKNIHQFFEQEDGSFKFGTEAESEAAVASVFNAIKSLEGATVLSEYENGIGRVAISETKMAVIELITETETSETGEEETFYGYYVTVTDIPNYPAQAVAIAEALGVSRFEFVEDSETGAWFIPANDKDTTLWADEKTNLGALLDALKTIPGIEFEDPQIQDENDEYWGSYYVVGLLDGKLVILKSVRVGKDENWNGYYSAQIIVADPKEEDPTVSAFMQAVASFLGIEVEFNQITGAYTFGEAYPAELSFDVNTMEAALREAFPDAEFSFELELDEYGDPVITIVYAGYEIEAHVEDWTFEEDPYYWIYAYCEAAAE